LRQQACWCHAGRLAFRLVRASAFALTAGWMGVQTKLKKKMIEAAPDPS